MDTVDILLATYNGGRFLREQLKSLAEQTHTDWQVLARDDSSRDDTPDLLQEFAGENPNRVKVIADAKGSLGASGNFAELLQHSTSDYTMFCDQDDVWLPQKIELSLAKVAELERVHGKQTPLLVHTDLKVVAPDLAIISGSLWQHQYLNPAHGQIWQRLLLQNVVTGCTVIANKALREAVLPIPKAAIMHDWWLALGAALVGRIEYIPEATVLYRQHGLNDTGAKRWGLSFVAGRLLKIREVRNSLSRTQIQAGALGEHLAYKLDPATLEVIRRFAALRQMGPLRRRLFLLNNGILKTGLTRNLGLMVNV